MRLVDSRGMLMAASRFADRLTERFWSEGTSPGLPASLLRKARRCLAEVLVAETLASFLTIPGYKFKKLQAHDPPRYSIRINDQYRVTFEWSDGQAVRIKIEDYH